jgi:hypothetical protein
MNVHNVVTDAHEKQIKRYKQNNNINICKKNNVLNQIFVMRTIEKHLMMALQAKNTCTYD